MLTKFPSPRTIPQKKIDRSVYVARDASRWNVQRTDLWWSQSAQPFDDYGVRYDIVRSTSSRSNALQLRDIRVQTEETECTLQRERATLC